MNKLICRICDAKCKNYVSLSKHITLNHNMTTKKYYDLYFKIDKENICNSCNKNETRFINLNEGYSKNCSSSCYNKSEKHRKIVSERFENNPYALISFRKKISDSNIDWSSAIKKRNNTVKKKYNMSISEFNRMQALNQWKKYSVDKINDIVSKVKETKIKNGTTYVESTRWKNVPKITYFDSVKNKNRRYYTDIFLKNYNLLIEVKSTWTYKVGEINNIEKMKQSLKDGFNFCFIILQKPIFRKEQFESLKSLLVEVISNQAPKCYYITDGEGSTTIPKGSSFRVETKRQIPNDRVVI